MPTTKRLYLPIALLFCVLTTGLHAAPSPDFNGDGRVSFEDFVTFAQHFGTRQSGADYDAKFDLDNSGDVGFNDFVQFATQFGQTVAPAQEPNQHAVDAAIGGAFTYDGGPTVRIPPGAVSANGALTIAPVVLDPGQEPQDAQRITDVFEIHLDSADILAPIELAIPYDPLKLPPEATIHSLYAVWWDGENWRPIKAEVDPAFIYVQVDHLSTWTGVFAQVPVIERFAVTPDAVELVPNTPKTLRLDLQIDPAGLPTSDLRTRLKLALLDSITSSGIGTFTLNDNGQDDSAIFDPISGLSLRSTDPTESLDGGYGAELTFNAEGFPAHAVALRLGISITTRRAASVAVDTALIIPITRAPVNLHAIAGRVVLAEGGVPDVTIALSGPSVQTVTTDADGRFTFSDLADDIYVITPFKPDHVFSPESLSLALSGADISGVEFLDVSAGPTFAGGPALELDGTGYLAIDVAPGSPLDIDGALTIEAWIQPSDRTPRTIAGRWQGDSDTPPGSWRLGTHSAGVGDNHTAFIAEFEPGLQLENWTHYALVLQQAWMQIYVNGVEMLNTPTGIPSPLSGASVGDPLIIGGFHNGQGASPPAFKGLIDEVRIYNRALSAKDIRDNMHRMLTSTFGLHQAPVRAKQSLSGGLVGHWNFDTHTADGAVPDLSGNGHAGRIAGGATFVQGNAPLAAAQGNPVLQIYPPEITFEGDATEIEATIRNAGSGQLVWTLFEDVKWLRVSSPQGHTGGDGAYYGQGDQTLTISATAAGLPPDTYTTRLQVWSSGGLLDWPITMKGGDAPISNAFQVITPAGTIHDMTQVPAGEFTMGSLEAEPNAQPPHEVYLDAYLIDRFEVTNAQFDAFLQFTTYKRLGSASDSQNSAPEQPVVDVTWGDADTYCRWIGGRLPTEAEWEKAARGINGRTYPWGNAAPDASLLNFDRNTGQAVAVGSYEKGAGPYDTYDMAGNVWEWTQDWFGGAYYADSPLENPTGPERGTVRVARGGSWGERAPFMRAFNRFWFAPNTANELIGFRCVAPTQP